MCPILNLVKDHCLYVGGFQTKLTIWLLLQVGNPTCRSRTSYSHDNCL